jgi:hypothetical protein
MLDIVDKFMSRASRCEDHSLHCLVATLISICAVSLAPEITTVKPTNNHSRFGCCGNKHIDQLVHCCVRSNKTPKKHAHVQRLLQSNDA